MEHYYSGNDAAGEKLERNKVLLSYINDKGHDVTYNHKLIKLVQDDAGKVTGAIFEADGGYVQVNAAKGVLLTTGGYTSNAEMLRACKDVYKRQSSDRCRRCRSSRLQCACREEGRHQQDVP